MTPGASDACARAGHRRRRVVLDAAGGARTVCDRCGDELGALHPPPRGSVDPSPSRGERAPDAGRRRPFALAAVGELEDAMGGLL